MKRDNFDPAASAPHLYPSYNQLSSSGGVKSQVDRASVSNSQENSTLTSSRMLNAGSDSNEASAPVSRSHSSNVDAHERSRDSLVAKRREDDLFSASLGHSGSRVAKPGTTNQHDGLRGREPSTDQGAHESAEMNNKSGPGMFGGEDLLASWERDKKVSTNRSLIMFNIYIIHRLGKHSWKIWRRA